ncbi:MAG: hypothetical protein J0I06_04925 [Planctomycetes bacterium]|nr:hypothetical protein [Planctomycetota bacterium]
MYEAERETLKSFEPETLRRMREVFAGEVCAVCGAPAERLCAELFYCHDHYPKAKKVSRSYRTYHCAIPVEE